jgi:secreted PhoX family phosphatase
MAGEIDRRRFLGLGVAATAAVGVAGALELPAAALGVDQAGDGPYGPLGPPDANGIQLPGGFRARELARGDAPVAGTDYPWPVFPDGGATFPARGGGWTYVANSEHPAAGAGGVSALRFSSGGELVDAYRILDGTQTNCAGGATPWRTWLSGEEYPEGQVWECDPAGRRPGRALPALGRFEHEAAAVDPKDRRVYLTEDVPDGRFYRFTPKKYPSLDAGKLEAAVVAGNGSVTWQTVPDPAAGSTPTREQVPESTPFDGGEGIAYHRGTVYFTTKGDERVWEYDTRRKRVRVLYDGRAHPELPLNGVDNVTITPRGSVLVAEDHPNDNLELVMLTRDGLAAPLLRVTGHGGSELAGPAFSPDGSRLYFSSQRGGGGSGITYEVTGPFRRIEEQRVSSAGMLPSLPVGNGVALTLAAAGALLRLRARGHPGVAPD